MKPLQETATSWAEIRERELESKGTLNSDVEESMPQGGLTNGAHIEGEERKKCQLCKINRPPFSAEETVYFEDDDFYMVDTYNRKNHDIRNMAVQKAHGDIPPVEENIRMLDRLADITSSHIQDGEMILYGSMGTFTEHYHLVASDIYGEDPEKVEDLADINSYARFRVEDGEPEYLPDESRYRDSFGDYLERWTELSPEIDPDRNI